VRRIESAIALARSSARPGSFSTAGIRLALRLPAGKVVRTCAALLRELAEAAEKAGTDLFVENVFDEIPDHLLRLREAVGSPRLHFCFDPGHATLFSRLPVQKWRRRSGRIRRCTCTTTGDGGTITFRQRRGINFRGSAGVRDAGGRPILTVDRTAGTISSAACGASRDPRDDYEVRRSRRRRGGEVR